jgi:hypothetical protein
VEAMECGSGNAECGLKKNRRSEVGKVRRWAFGRWRSASGFALRASDFALRATPGQDDPTGRFRLEAKKLGS